MPDHGHELTEKRLIELEKKISAEYAKAYKDLGEKTKNYFESFIKRDADQKALLDAEQITEDQYTQWRLAQIGRGERFETMRDQVAERMTRANEVAISYVNDATPGIYSLNRNYAAYTIEQVSGDVGFTLMDEATARRLIIESPDLMPNYPEEKAVKRGIDLTYGKKQITAQVTSSILQGESVGKVSDRLQEYITDMNRTSAIRAARTAATGAQNAGRLDSYIAAEKMGIKIKKKWLATLDGRTRHSHAALDGTSVDNDKNFPNRCKYPGDPGGPAEEIYNCRCTMIADVGVAEAGESLRRDRYGLTPDRTYAQWETSKRGEGYLQTAIPHAQRVRETEEQYESLQQSGLLRLPSIDTFAEQRYTNAPVYERLVARYETLTGARKWSAIEFNPETLADHAERHKQGMGLLSAREYEDAAIDFVNSDIEKETFVASEDGKRRFYEESTNTFASVYPDGTVSTFFKPRQGRKYWKGQVKKYGK
ncbi:MAG: phage minor head protein [Oscillospiraceae bacterium]|nr:phage minor head protein [Oscillospiraceae bacterium]